MEKFNDINFDHSKRAKNYYKNAGFFTKLFFYWVNNFFMVN